MKCSFSDQEAWNVFETYDYLSCQVSLFAA